MLPATEKNLRNFGLVMAAFLAILACLFLFRGKPENRVYVLPALGGAAATFALLGAAAPRLLVHIYRPWMAMAHVMGLVMTTVLLTLIYFTLLLPFTLIRMKDPLRKKLGASTYWEPHRNPEPTLERFRRPF